MPQLSQFCSDYLFSFEIFDLSVNYPIECFQTVHILDKAETVPPVFSLFSGVLKSFEQVPHSFSHMVNSN